MATTNRILLKKSSVEGKIPGPFDIEFGELALNFSDGRLYFKNSDNNIDFFSSGISGNTLPLAANEANFGEVSTTLTKFSFNLGKTTEVETFSHDLGIIELTSETEEQDLTSFESDFDLGSVALTTESSFDFGSVTGSIVQSLDLGKLVISGAIFPNVFVLPSTTVANLPEGITGQMLFVTDEVNGPAPAFYDGNAWKRLSDNQIVTAT
jgi:hypothetical protein